MIVKPMTTAPLDYDSLPVDVDVIEDDPLAPAAALIEEPALPPPAFDANLADYLSEETLSALSNRWEELLESDLLSRKDWEDAYTRGLDLLGIMMVDRNFPWRGACGVTHPMILESAVRFQSKASVRLFPAKGPADARVYGAQTEDQLAASRRVRDDLNYYALEKMPEYYPDTEQLLFSLPVAGSAFRKIYHDYSLRRPAACFVPAVDFVMPAGFPHLESCPRYAELYKKSHADVRRLQQAGYWRDCDLRGATLDRRDADEKEDRLSGTRPQEDHNELYSLVEMHLDTRLSEDADEDPDYSDGDETASGPVPLPYVVVWERSQRQVLSIRRNWVEDDPLRRKIVHFVHYRYVPGLSSYGYGLIHLIGSIAKSATSLLRQLIDSGTLANIPGGFKARTFRVKGEDEPIAPGEWRDVDVASGKITDGLLPLPYKEPSGVLYSLYKDLTQQGKEFASIADLDITSMSANAPVGTILALIERASEVITAVQARLHASFKIELNLIADCIRRYDSDAYDYEVANAPRSIKRADYARRMSIRPVSDPAAATTAQRVMQLQAAMNFAQQAPQIYDIPRLHREMLSTLGIEPPEDLVPEPKTPPLDPVSENMAMIASKPVKAYEFQDHAAHIQVHMAFAQDQQLQQTLSQSPLANSIMGAYSAHLAEHIGFEYRKQIEKHLGVPLPAVGEPIPPEIEQQLSQLEAQAGRKLAQERAAKQQQEEQKKKQQDPLYQLEQERVKIEAQAVQVKAQTAEAKAQTDMAKLQAKAAESQEKTALERERIAAQAATAQAKTQAQAASDAGRIRSEAEIRAADLEERRNTNEEELRQGQEKLRLELADMKATLEIALRKLDLERDKLASAERRSEDQVSSQQAQARTQVRSQELQTAAELTQREEAERRDALLEADRTRAQERQGERQHGERMRQGERQHELQKKQIEEQAKQREEQRKQRELQARQKQDAGEKPKPENGE